MQIITGDLIALTEEERKQHYLDMCVALNINPATRPLAYFEQMGYGGKRTLILYTLRGGAQQIAATNNISTSVVRDRDSEVDGVVAFKARATKGNRAVESVGAAVIGKNNPADSIMTAQTKATRRAILDFTGSGLLDETEVEGMNGDTIACDPGVGNEAYIPPPPAPVPSSEPATEVKPEICAPSTYAEHPIIDPKITAAVDSLVGNMVTSMKADIAAAQAPAVPQVYMIPETLKQDMDKIVVRLNSYRRDTLQLGGMRPSKGFGIAAKWAKFLAKHAPNKTIEEYQTLLTALDLCLEQLGPNGVVAKIEKEIA